MLSSPRKAARRAASPTRLTSATATTTRPRPSSPGSMARWPTLGRAAGQFILFDQQPFSEPGDGFADEGVVYVPQSCAEQPGCRVHIALHGCEQSREAMGDTFVKDSRLCRDRRHQPARRPVPASQGEHRSTRMAAGTGGAIPGSTISARTRRRSRRSGPWSSSLPRHHEATDGTSPTSWSSRRRSARTSTARR